MLFSNTATITTDASGDATVYCGSRIRGKVVAIQYAPGTLATGATLTITGETSGVPILTKASAGTSTVWFYPKNIAHKVSDGSEYTDMGACVAVCEERVKVVVASGGNTKTGSITIYTDEEQ